MIVSWDIYKPLEEDCVMFPMFRRIEELSGTWIGYVSSVDLRGAQEEHTVRSKP